MIKRISMRIDVEVNMDDENDVKLFEEQMKQLRSMFAVEVIDVECFET